MIVYGINAQRSLQWAGYQWFLRDDQNSGPGKCVIWVIEPFSYVLLLKGPNNWNSSNVWIDENQRLHLKLRYSSSTASWTCAELYTKVKFSFGTFRWFIEGAIDQFDPNVVFGLFTYGGVDGTNEIDIEIAKWGQTDSRASNYFYTIYPYALGVARPTSSGTRLSLSGTYTTHQFIWSPRLITLQIQGGFMTSSQTQNVIFSYKTPANFSCAIPYVSAPLHMNLWAFRGKPPINGREVEIIIHGFQYTKTVH